MAKQKKEAEARAAAAATAAKSTNKQVEKSTTAVKETKPGVTKGIPQSLLDRVSSHFVILFFVFLFLNLIHPAWVLEEGGGGSCLGKLRKN